MHIGKEVPAAIEVLISIGSDHPQLAYLGDCALGHISGCGFEQLVVPLSEERTAISEGCLQCAVVVLQSPLNGLPPNWNVWVGHSSVEVDDLLGICLRKFKLFRKS